MIVEAGSTRFECADDYSGRAKIATAEGSTIAVPVEDLLKFAAQYARNQMALALDQMHWQEVLGVKRRK